jgi:hypothetical protein
MKALLTLAYIIKTNIYIKSSKLWEPIQVSSIKQLIQIY